MKIRMTGQRFYVDRVRMPGEELDATPSIADKWIAEGVAIPLEPETAAGDQPEQKEEWQWD